MGMPARSATGMKLDDSSRNLASMEAMLQRLMALPAAPGENPAQQHPSPPGRSTSAQEDAWSPSSSTWGPLAEVWKSGGQPDTALYSQPEALDSRPARKASAPVSNTAPSMDISVQNREQRTWLILFNDMFDNMVSGFGPVGRFLATTAGHWLLALAGIGFWGWAAYILMGGTIPWQAVGIPLD